MVATCYTYQKLIGKALVKGLFTLFLLLLYCHPLAAQRFLDQKFYLVDSLEKSLISKDELHFLDSSLKKYHQTKADTLKNQIIYDLIEGLYNDKVWTRYNTLLKKRLDHLLGLNNLHAKEKLSHLKFLSSYYNNVGYFNKISGNINQALYNYNKARDLLKNIKDLIGLGTNYNNIGFVYFDNGNIPKALDYFYKSARTYHEVNVKEKGPKKKEALKKLGIIYNNIGLVFSRQGDYSLALENYSKAYEYNFKLKDKGGMALCLGNMGSVKVTNAEKLCKQNSTPGCVQALIKEGMQYLKQSLQLDKEINFLHDYARTLHNIALAFGKLNMIDSAMLYYSRSIVLKRENGDKSGLCLSLEGLAEMELRKGNYKKSKELVEEGYALALALGFPTHIYNAARLLSKIYEKEGNSSKALELYKVFDKMHDSVNNQENLQAVFRKNVELEYEKKKLTDSMGHAKEAEIKDIKIAAQQSELSSEKNKKIAMLTGLLSVLVIAFLLFNRFRATQRQKNIIQEQKKLVEEKQHEIIDSINYAQRLQQAILATEADIQTVFKSYFLLYLPKDIVAGDFYFFDKTDTHAFIAAADCTGHGVPGAMVSVICSNALTQCIHEYKISRPGEILDKARELVIDTFKKSGKEVKDGMDISLLVKNLQNNTYEWAGANNSTFVISPGSGLKQEIKSNKQPVGMTEHKQPFTTHVLDLKTNDWIYLFTDGYHDQFGSHQHPMQNGNKPVKGKKLKKSNMFDLFEKHVNANVDQYKQKILEEFYTWKGEFEQIDDVCIIGIKID